MKSDGRQCLDCNQPIQFKPHGYKKVRCDPCQELRTLSYYKKYNKDNFEHIEKTRPRNNDIVRYSWEFARGRAKKNNIPFDIYPEDIINFGYCPVLGTEFEKGTSYAASLDKFNNELGYVKGNVMMMSRKANTMKNSANFDELRMFAKWVLNTLGDPDEEYQNYMQGLT